MNKGKNRKRQSEVGWPKHSLHTRGMPGYALMNPYADTVTL